MSNSRIIELAQSISAKTEEFEKYLRENNLPSPSFDVDSPPVLPLSPEAALNRLAILDNVDEMRSLMLGSLGVINDLGPFTELLSLQHINRRGLANAVPVGGEATYEEIGQKCGISEPVTRRLLRHAMTRRIFRERRPGVVEHTGSSRLLVENPKTKAFVGMILDDMWANIPFTSEALDKWKESQEPNHTGFNLAWRVDESMWYVLDRRPEVAQRFAGAMEAFQEDPGFSLSHVVNNYDWASVGNGTIVDIGGSTGALMTAVCETFPNVHAIVQDLPETASKGLARLASELSNRIEFMSHDFFTEQPVKGAEIYMFRWILHDWSDLYVVKILKALAPAMREHSKLLIWDTLVPEPGQSIVHVEKFIRTFDLAMLACFNGKEREASEWPKILHEADPRYKFLNAKQPPASNLGLVEVGWQP